MSCVIISLEAALSMDTFATLRKTSISKKTGPYMFESGRFHDISVYARIITLLEVELSAD